MAFHAMSICRTRPLKWWLRRSESSNLIMPVSASLSASPGSAAIESQSKITTPELKKSLAGYGAMIAAWGQYWSWRRLSDPIGDSKSISILS